MNKNSSIHSLRQKRAQSVTKNQHFKNNLQSIAKDIKFIQDNLNTLRETSRQKSLTSSQNFLQFKNIPAKKSKSKNKKKAPSAKENVEYDDHYHLKPLDKLKKKSKTYREDDSQVSVLKDTAKDPYQMQISIHKNPADTVSKFHQDMLPYLSSDKHSQFESLLRKMIKLLQ